MRTFCGAVTETNDMGVVAEHCPHCDRLKSCLLRTVRQGNYICFIKIADMLRESSCLCTECLKPFTGKPYWSYAAVVPIRDARDMTLGELLVKTNPILADRIHFKEQIRDLGGDERFAVSYERIEGMRPGWLRSNLMRNLMEWPQLGEFRREELDQHIGALSQAWRFARHIAIGFPTSSGSLFYFLSVPVFGLILVGMIVTRSWIWGLIALAACVVAATVLESVLFKRSVGQWVRKVLIPEAEESNVPLDRFVTVVDDIPKLKLGLSDDLWPIKDQLDHIREVLIAEGKLQPLPTEAKQ